MQLGEMKLGEMQHFNNTPLGEMQSGKMQLSQIKNYKLAIYLFNYLTIWFPLDFEMSIALKYHSQKIITSKDHLTKTSNTSLFKEMFDINRLV
ncbi:hypothetical protein U3516DRAFT_735685 [Neocallimastix sp. 'constans']